MHKQKHIHISIYLHTSRIYILTQYIVRQVEADRATLLILNINNGNNSSIYTPNIH